MDNKVTVSRRAVFVRLKRALAKDAEYLHATRWNSRWINDLGNYYVVDSRNHLVGVHLDLEGVAREKGLLRPYEEMADD